jgi:phage tail sheath protein FI
MAFQLSPGINVSEVDLTTVVPAVGTTVGGLVGEAVWGPVNQVISISSEDQFVSVFGKPDANTYKTFFTMSNFLSYGSDLRFVRTANSGTYNATSNTTAANRQVKNIDDYNSISNIGTAEYWIAKYPGDIGNSLQVSVCANNSLFATWAQGNTVIASAPATSDWTSNQGGANDELHIVVIDRLGKFSGTANTVLETFSYVSKASDAKKSDGTSNYYVNVVNQTSKYIWWGKHLDATWGVPASNTTFTQTASISTLNLANGTTATTTAGNYQTSWDKFNNSDSSDTSLLMMGQSTDSSTIVNYVIAIAESRKDVLVFVSPQQSDVVNNAGGEAAAVVVTRNTYTSSSYAEMDCGWKYQYDKYNDVYRWVPLNGDIAGLCVRTDLQRDPWFSPAGYRGQILNVVKLAWNPNKSERDTLYKNGVNPVVTFPGEGTLLYGDKTMLSRPSAFDRINVRRLFIVLEQAIAKAARSSLFEFNDDFTRAQFVAFVEPFLRDVKGRRGIYDYRVVCDTTNNTPQVIDSNQFVGDIYIKPARSINFIQLNFVAVRTGVSFDEIVGKF